MKKRFSAYVILTSRRSIFRKLITRLYMPYIGALLLIALGVPAHAADKNILCVQTFLQLNGFDLGPIDGTINKATSAAAAEYKSNGKLQIEDLSPATAEAWCGVAKADEQYTNLLNYTYNSEVLSHKGVQGDKNYDQILLGDSVGNFLPAERNIKKPDALSFIGLNGGVSAARISVNYKDKGHPADWFYNDKPGVQQRFELTEQRKFSMRPNKTYWLRMSVFIPKGVHIDDHLTITDIKPMIKGWLADEVVSLTFGRDILGVHNIIGKKQECVFTFNKAGTDNGFCDRTKEQDFIAPTANIEGRWLNFVYRVHWANDTSGSYHLWLDDKFVLGLAGNSDHGAEFLTNKFGVYRGYYHTQGIPQPDVSMYFTGIGRSQTCEGLGLKNCATLSQDITRFDTPMIYEKNLVVETEKTDFLKAGGKPRR